MKVYLNTYRTFTQKKKVYELIDKKDTQWIIYQNNEPKFYVDLFDLTTESNAMMNSLVLCSKRTLDEVLEILNRKNNIKLSVPKISKFGLKKKVNSEIKELSLEPLPEKWLAYSL